MGANVLCCVLVNFPAFTGTRFCLPWRDSQAESTWMVD